MTWKSEIPSNHDPIPKRTAEQLAKALRKHCIWQQEHGTKDDNGYPFHKHLPDCTICEAADALESMSKALAAGQELMRHFC